MLFAVSPFVSLGVFQAQGELLVEHMQNTGEVVLASSSHEGQTLIRNEIRALSESFHTLFNGESYTSALILQPTVWCEREVD